MKTNDTQSVHDSTWYLFGVVVDGARKLVLTIGSFVELLTSKCQCSYVKKVSTCKNNNNKLDLNLHANFDFEQVAGEALAAVLRIGNVADAIVLTRVLTTTAANVRLVTERFADSWTSCDCC